MNKFNFFFTNKEVKIVNLAKILRSKYFFSKMPSDMFKNDILMVTYLLMEKCSSIPHGFSDQQIQKSSNITNVSQI